MKLLPIGTVIKVNNHKVCIIGYGSVDTEERSICGYFVVLYPVGFTSIEKVLFVPYYTDFEVVVEGYKTDISARALDAFAKGFEMIEKIPEEELLKIGVALKKVATKREGNEA